MQLEMCNLNYFLSNLKLYWENVRHMIKQRLLLPNHSFCGFNHEMLEAGYTQLKAASTLELASLLIHQNLSWLTFRMTCPIRLFLGRER